MICDAPVILLIGIELIKKEAEIHKKIKETGRKKYATEVYQKWLQIFNFGVISHVD